MPSRTAMTTHCASSHVLDRYCARIIAALVLLAAMRCPPQVRAATPPSVQTVQPLPGTVTSLTQITVTFSEAVTNVVATDLRINDVPSLSVWGSGATYTVTLEQQPGYGPVQIHWDPAHTIVDLDPPPNRFDETAPGASWQYDLIDVAPPVVSVITPSAG